MLVLDVRKVGPGRQGGILTRYLARFLARFLAMVFCSLKYSVQVYRVRILQKVTKKTETNQ